jgi:hypothetical protein
MQLSNIILFILASIGMTHIIVDGNIFESTRSWLKKHLPEHVYSLFECYQCTGFWCGVIVGYFIIAVFQPWWIQFPITFFCGCASSYLSVLAITHMNALEAQTVIAIKDGD